MSAAIALVLLATAVAGAAADPNAQAAAVEGLVGRLFGQAALANVTVRVDPATTGLAGADTFSFSFKRTG